MTKRKYTNFRGVDFRGDEVSLLRSPDSVNVWKDYRTIDCIRTRPGMYKKVKDFNKLFSSRVYGIFFYTVGDTEMMLVHCGDKLYKVLNASRKDEEITVLYEHVNTAKSDAFIYNNIWYFKDGKNYLQYDGTTIKNVEGYIPTTSIGRSPAGGGKIHEDVNMLSDYRINTFVGDGTSTEYHLDTDKIDLEELLKEMNDGNITSDEFRAQFPNYIEVTVNDEKYTGNIGYDGVNGKGVIKLNPAPPSPLTDGQDNVKIKFKKTVDGHRDRINNCTLLQVFDNRVFFSGNKDYPNVMWHCSLNDPTYCSDLDYYNEGLDSAAVKGMVAGNNVLWVFKEPSQANTTVFYHTPTIDSEYGKIYPNAHSSIATGCVGKAINFNDDIVFFSKRGMEGISGAITSEQVIAHRSSLVDRKLIAESDYENMILAEWEGYLLVFIDDKVYLADSRAMFANEDHTEYEWFYWDLTHKITCAKVNNGVLYLGTIGGVFTLTDMSVTADVESWWVTSKDKFDNPQYLKTTNKRGCVVESTGDVSVYAKTEKTDFELIGEYKDITDYFVSKIKRKKFKDIQLKFYSNTRFSLECATLECFVGGYIKR